MNNRIFTGVYVGFRIPLVKGGFAWIDLHGDMCLTKEEKVYSVESMYKTDLKNYIHYLNQIKSGEGNWIVHPKADNYWITWHDIIHHQAEVVYITLTTSESWSTYRNTINE